jgi:uncharacterized protein YdeI (YjbR/CyaY-like superfamily)
MNGGFQERLVSKTTGDLKASYPESLKTQTRHVEVLEEIIGTQPPYFFLKYLIHEYAIQLYNRYRCNKSPISVISALSAVKKPMAVKDDLEILTFKSQKHWERWLAKNHSKSKGIWLRFFKKGSGIKTVTPAQALDEALCYGWIDGQLKKYDEQSWLHKFTPRRPRSMWSKRNIEHIERLMKAGKIKPAGLKEIKAAKTDGRWEQAYDSPGAMRLPEDFLKELSKNKRAKAFLETLNRANTYAIVWRLQTAKKPETRASRMKAIIEMLSRREKFH